MISVLKEKDKDPDDVVELFNDIRRKKFESYKNRLKDCSVWVGEELNGSVDAFEFLSDFFNIDIYIVRDTTRQPYRRGNCEVLYNNRPSIIVLWVGNSHYEILGVRDVKKEEIRNKRLEEGESEKKTTIVKRTFAFDDPIIVKTRSIVCD